MTTSHLPFLRANSPRRSLARVCAPLLAWAVLSGCASVAPDSALPDLAQRHGSSASISPAAAAAGARLGVPPRAWWQDLGDARLDELVRQAMDRNAERQAALASVREARALAGQARREGLPQGRLSAEVQRVQPSIADADLYRQGLPRPPAQTLATIGQLVSWEIDLFGRVGTALAAAERQVDAAEADARGATALLQAEVVRQYVQLRRHQQTQLRLDEELEVSQQRLDRVRARVAAGLVDRREGLAIEAEREQLQAERSQGVAAVHIATSALAVLVGRSPTQTDAAWQALIAPADLPRLPADVAIVAPTDLLANRPDVARADALWRASQGHVVLAERAHLPRLSLAASFGLKAAAGGLGQAGAVQYAAGPMLQWDWLDLGRVQARADAAQAGSDRAWHGLESTVLKALNDSESALRGWVAAQDGVQRSQQAEQAASAAADYTAARARAGLEPNALALEQRVAYLRAQRGSLGARASALESFAQVQLALAAWQPEAEATR